MTIQLLPNFAALARCFVAFTILASLATTPAWAAMGDQLFKLTANNGGSLYGPVALNGNNALVGPYLFDVSTGQQLFDLDASNVITYGVSFDVALDGNRALLSDGAILGVDHAGYVFDTATGQQLKRLVPGDASFGFGISAAMSGNRALIGAAGNSAYGGAYLFDLTTGQRVAKFIAPDSLSNGSFGYSVELRGNMALIGANTGRIDSIAGFPGSAYFLNVATGQQLLKLTADDASDKDRFGSSVAFDGNVALIGAWADNPMGAGTANGVGSAYLFDLTTGQEIRKLTASDAQTGDNFGTSVAISGNMALVTGGGSSYLFDVTTGQELFQFGVGGDAALSGNRALISGGGAAYVFDVTPVPEPSALALALIAIGGFLMYSSRSAVRMKRNGC